MIIILVRIKDCGLSDEDKTPLRMYLKEIGAKRITRRSGEIHKTDFWRTLITTDPGNIYEVPDAEEVKSQLATYYGYHIYELRIKRDKIGRYFKPQLLSIHEV